MVRRGRPDETASRRWPPVLVLAAITAGATGCAGALDPAGPVAARQRSLFLLSVVVATVVVGVVLALVVVALRADRPLRDGNRFVVVGGLVLPSLVLLGIGVATVRALAAPPLDGDVLRVEVVGHQYWWEIRYPDLGVSTANELHVPVDTPVEVVLTSDDVIHSFWVPELGGKTDMVPGRVNTVTLQADELGEFWGRCAEFCGLQHARMQFLVVATSGDDFDRWVGQLAEPVAVRDSQVEQDLVANSCVACHTFQGIGEPSDVGPELTHFGSRAYLGAGTVPVTREDLRLWVRDAQALKPGAEMPPLPQLDDEVLDRIVDYLLALE